MVPCRRPAQVQQLYVLVCCVWLGTTAVLPAWRHHALALVAGQHLMQHMSVVHPNFPAAADATDLPARLTSVQHPPGSCAPSMLLATMFGHRDFNNA